MALILWGFPLYDLIVYLSNTHYIEHQDFNIWIMLLLSHPVVSNPLQPHWLAYLSLTISQSLLKFMCITSVMPTSHLILWHSFLLLPTSGIFPMSHLFTSDDQNTGASASASVRPVNIQGLRSLKMNSEGNTNIQITSSYFMTLFSI